MSLDPPVGGRDASSALGRLFAPAWAVAALFHLLGKIPFWGEWQGSVILDALVAACALALFLVPSSLLALLLLALVQLLSAVAEAPILSNHWLLSALVNLALLAAAAGAARGGLDPAAHWRLAAPVVRWQVILFYLLAALHKTNAAYLDPQTSCAALFAAEIASSLGMPALAGTEGARLAAWGSLAIEWAIPVLLAVPRLRLGGVVVGAVFHGVLALDLPRHFFDFSAVMYALLLVFLPARAVAQAAPERTAHRFGWSRLATAAVFAIAVAAALATDSRPSLLPLASGLAAGLWLGWAALLLAGLVLLLRRRRHLAPDPGALTLKRRWLVALPALVLVNGSAPYVGWKTGGAFNMYSNLRVEGDRPNHLFLPGSLGLAAGGGDLVAIVSSSDPELAGYGRRGLLLPWFELRDYLSRRPHTTVVYRRGDEVHALERAGDDPALVAPVPWWQRKLLLYRPVDAGPTESCRDTWGAVR